jgi:hypothetical protein
VKPLLYCPQEGLPRIAADMLVRERRTPEEVVAFLAHQADRNRHLETDIRGEVSL